MSEVLEGLLEAHVRHELARWRGAELERSVANEVAELFRWLDEVTLRDVAAPEQIMGVIERHVIEPRLGAGIAELAGETSRLVLSSPTSAQTRVDQILPDAAYEAFAEKVVALDSVWRELISLITASSAFADLSARVSARALADLALHTRGLPGASSGRLAAEVTRRFFPHLAARVQRLLSRRLAQSAARFARESERHLLELLDAKRLRAVLDEIWDAVSALRLSEAFSFIDEHDLEDFVVLGYEFWLRYRKSEYFRKTASEVVAYFFEKYGAESLATLIADMGVTEPMVVRELTLVLGPVLEHAFNTGFLEQRIRAQLEPFYRSPAAAAALRGK